MPEVITILSGAVASYATSPRSIPSGTFTILEHEGLVTLTVYGTSIGDNYARYAMVRVNGGQLKKWVVSRSFTFTTQLDLSPGTHTLEVEVTSWVGHWEISANVEYTPTETPPLPDIVGEIDVGAILLIIGIPILGIVAGYFATDGFTNIPDPTQIFSGIQLPF